MSRYEVWDKADVGQRKGLPKRTHFTLDMAMDSAKELSKGSTTKNVYNPKKKTPGVSWDGGYEDVDIPNSIAVIERADKQSRVRGWGVGGVWYDARDCKRCNNSGTDPTYYSEPCSSCKGASYKPKV